MIPPNSTIKISFRNNGKTIRKKKELQFHIKFLFMSVNPIENKNRK